MGLSIIVVAAPRLALLLYEVHPRDPAVIAAGALVLVLAAGVAALVPAQRAARVDPMVALRSD